MRKHGALMEFSAERSNSLLEACRLEMKNTQIFNLRRAAEVAVRLPAPRFWVSEERASDVLSMMNRGLPVLEGMTPCKQRMFREISRRVHQLARVHPEAALNRLVSQVIYQPAPEHYMQASRALQVVYAEIRRRRNGRK